MNGWQLHDLTGEASELVAATPEPEDRQVVVVRPDAATLILGSAQRFSDADTARAHALGIGVARRRSGGGAVLVAPDSQIWIDVFVPAGDRLADRDVGRAAWWLGDAWDIALRSFGPPSGSGAFEVHRGAMATTTWSRRVCFAGMGPGEVRAGERKYVGISQRRNRAGIWLHSMALTAFDPALLAALLQTDDDGDELARYLATAVGTTNVSTASVVAAICSVER
jgi:lipoate-protein ligase A